MNLKNIHTSEILEAVKTVELRNSRKTKLKILNFGAAIFSLEFLRQNGEYLNVIVGPKKPEDFLSQKYKEHNKGFGASIGRYAGRISGGKFSLDGQDYPIFNQEGIHLHGGDSGFTYKIWEIEEITKHPNPSVRLSYFSEDGEEGYPGNLKAEVTYTLTEKDEVIIEYKAETDKNTVVNLTNHAYFNLNGGGSIEDHVFHLRASQILEVDDQLIPTGNLLSLDGHQKDFRKPKKKAQLLLDDAFVLDLGEGPAASLYAPDTGMAMEVFTDQPAIVVYAPEALPTEWEYQTKIAEKFPSICLETQNFPDAPSRKHFPSALLEPGQQYENRSIFRFQMERKF